MLSGNAGPVLPAASCGASLRHRSHDSIRIIGQIRIADLRIEWRKPRP
jgi:hypothetical protein